MGVNLRDLFNRTEITLDDLKDKIIVIDSFNILYQFLTTIRSPEGNLFTDSHGNVTSHLIGLLSRTSNFVQKGIKPVFVFDGEVPKLKNKELQKRKEVKIEAQKKYEAAKEKEDVEEMHKYAARTSRLTKEMVEDAKTLLRSLGLPVIQAAGEGEAQASYMVKQGDGWAVGSQDYDSLLYATPKLVQNLSVVGRKKKKGVLGTVTIQPELIDLKPNLEKLGVNNDQLIALAMLVGTDYNQGGIKGIGPKNALKLVKKHGNEFIKLFSEVKWNDYFDYPWEDVYNTFKKMQVTKDYKIEFGKVNKEEVFKFLVDKRDFGRERIEKTIEPLLNLQKQKTQKGLGDF